MYTLRNPGPCPLAVRCGAGLCLSLPPGGAVTVVDHRLRDSRSRRRGSVAGDYPGAVADDCEGHGSAPDDEAKTHEASHAGRFGIPPRTGRRSRRRSSPQPSLDRPLSPVQPRRPSLAEEVAQLDREMDEYWAAWERAGGQPPPAEEMEQLNRELDGYWAALARDSAGKKTPPVCEPDDYWAARGRAAAQPPPVAGRH